MTIGSWKISPVLAWYDLWIGAFYDRGRRSLYILPVPCIGIKIEFGRSRMIDVLAFMEQMGESKASLRRQGYIFCKGCGVDMDVRPFGQSQIEYCHQCFDEMAQEIKD